jgi:hypothetical protein
MSRRSSLSYREALRRLAPGNSRINQIDKYLSAALIGGGAITHGATATLLGPKSALLQVVRDFTGNPNGRIRTSGGKSYYELLEASHTVLALSSFFDAFRTEVGPDFDRLELTDEEKAATAVANRRGRSLPDEIDSGHFPLPSSVRGLGEARTDVENAYVALYDATIVFCEGLAAWPEVRRGLDLKLLRTRVVERSMRNYDDRFDRLATDLPEFGFRTLRQALEHGESTNREMSERVVNRLDALETLFQNLSGLPSVVPVLAADPLRESLDRLAEYMTSVFKQPLLRIKGVDFHLAIPAVENGFISPDFRIAEYDRKYSKPEMETWWKDQPWSADLVGFLSDYLTDPNSPHRPLLVLGQPGAGKTLLTRVIAARLPSSRFTSIVVPLKLMMGDMTPTEQIEWAFEQLTDDRVRWKDLREATKATTVVVVFDGFDELVQVTGTAHSQYIERVAEFQERQWELGFSIIPIITSRILVMDRASLPHGTVMVRLEDLADQQVVDWVHAVNRENEHQRNFRRFSAHELLAHGEGLVRQPLLLTLLAIYYNERTVDQRPDYTISQSDLFTGLLTAFIRRQVAEKSPKTLSTDELAAREQRLRDELAITAFAMFNRSREVVNRAHLRADLACLGTAMDDVSPPGDQLGPEQLVTTAFFVVYGPDDLQGEDTRRTYEFLHATFGDFLIAEHVIQSLGELADVRGHLRAGSSAQLSTGRIRALLSHQPLVKRDGVMAFAKELSAKLKAERRAAIGKTIVALLAQARQRADIAGIDRYEPIRYDPVRLLAAYTANLVILAAVVAGDGGVAHTDLMDEETWASTVRLWRAGLDEKGQLAMIGWLGRDAAGRITVVRREHLEAGLNVAAEEARLVGDVTVYGQLRAGERTWRSQHPDSFESGRLHADMVGLSTRRWPVPSLDALTLYDERKYRGLLERASRHPEAMSSTTATLLLECLAEDGGQLPRDLVCALTGLALSRLPTSVTAPPELIISCPYLIDEFPAMLESVGTPEGHAVLHALILGRGLKRLPARYVDRVQNVVEGLTARLDELPVEEAVVSAEMVEQFADAEVGNRTALWLLIAVSGFSDFAWRKIPPAAMSRLLGHRRADEFLDEARLCRILCEYLREYGRTPGGDTLADALAELGSLATAHDAV